MHTCSSIKIVDFLCKSMVSTLDKAKNIIIYLGFRCFIAVGKWRLRFACSIHICTVANERQCVRCCLMCRDYFVLASALFLCIKQKRREKRQFMLAARPTDDVDHDSNSNNSSRNNNNNSNGTKNSKQRTSAMHISCKLCACPLSTLINNTVLILCMKKGIENRQSTNIVWKWMWNIVSLSRIVKTKIDSNQIENGSNNIGLDVRANKRTRISELKFDFGSESSI